MLTIPSVDDDALLNQRGLNTEVRSTRASTPVDSMSNLQAFIALDQISAAAIGHAVLSAIRSVGVDSLVLDADVMSMVEERIRESNDLGNQIPRTKHSDAAIETALRIGALELDLLKRKATHNGHTLDLRPTELKVLECLMRRADQIVTRTMIFEDVWNCHFDPHTNRIDVHVGKLRRKLAAQDTGPHIHTFRGAGYMLK
ncbi:two-component system, OmpR family, response regulator [Paraburkholderia phenazinium]|uniref:Two-component system, OmpR family, response regulator n=2 Tax=Paraburkholderia phenazinium TaxID=60549 RepID=A0A1N6KD45_9BURK|nr:two-component system, OmpR family, response regulator [Paraburkholderia phenazinium]